MVLEGSELSVTGNSLMVQWLGLLDSTEGDTGSIPGQGTKIPHATQCGQKRKFKKKRKELSVT